LTFNTEIVIMLKYTSHISVKLQAKYFDSFKFKLKTTLYKFFQFLVINEVNCRRIFLDLNVSSKTMCGLSSDSRGELKVYLNDERPGADTGFK